MKKGISIQMLFTVVLLIVFYRSDGQINRYYQRTPAPVREYNLYTPDYNTAALILERERRRTEQAEEEAFKAKYKGKLQLYGGLNGHDSYFGCINCSSDDPLSIWNYSGTFGLGNRNLTDNIWNESSPFGRTSGDYSPWSSAALSPPAIVDFDGDFYGYLTANRSKLKRTDIEYCNQISENYSYVKSHYSEMGAKFE
jgi:hypothetical protein